MTSRGGSASHSAERKADADNIVVQLPDALAAPLRDWHDGSTWGMALLDAVKTLCGATGVRVVVLDSKGVVASWNPGDPAAKIQAFEPLEDR
jgi:hypothetical protein